MTNEEINNLILDNQKLAYSLVYKYKNRTNLSFDELKSAALFGLVKAANTFDDDKFQFSTYAYRVITNEILLTIKSELKTKKIVSYDNKLNNHEEDNLTFLDIFFTNENIEEDYLVKEKVNKLKQFIDELPDRYGIIVNLKLQGLNQMQIGRELNISQSQVCLLYKQALNMLRTKFELEGDLYDDIY